MCYGEAGPGNEMPCQKFRKLQAFQKHLSRLGLGVLGNVALTSQLGGMLAGRRWLFVCP
jgi:hypothetical protein